MKAVRFKLVTRNLETLKNEIRQLSTLCQTRGLTLEAGEFLGGIYSTSSPDGSNRDFRASLQIPKIKTVTYQEIYQLVNTVRPSPFKIVSL